MQERLERLKILAINQCDECKIPIDKSAKVIINSRTTKRYGCCKKKSDGFVIEISKFLFETTDEKILQTLLHEYIHTCKDCLDHKAKWKEYASVLNKKYGYSITRVNTRSEMGLPPRPKLEYKYILECSNPKCKMNVKRMKMTKVIKHYDKYLCGKCGSKFIRKK